MKKQILVIMPGAMELGGVEKSLIGLLSGMDFDQYEVDMFLYGHYGSLYSMIPQGVHILPEVKELAYLRNSMKEKLMHGCFYSAWLRLRDTILSRGKPIDYDKTWAQVMRHCAKPLPKQYDLALSFFLPFDFLDEMVSAKVKVGWIHTDYTTEKINLDSLRQQCCKVDKIVTVSEKSRDVLLACLPEMEEKTMMVENILPSEMVRKDSNAFEVTSEMPEKGIRLLSVGRYCTAKNYDNVPAICRRLLQKGLDVYWYIIGFGADEVLIRSKIAEAGMEDRVILLGKKENPYPYMKACDLYVQPSRYEGKAVAVREAQMLGKPVVITRFPTSASQLEDGVDGIIVPMDNESCADGIAALLKDPEKMLRLQENCLRNDYSNSTELKKIYALMENEDL